MRTAILAALLLLAACGKVGEPLPPIIRIPLKVDNLKAIQTGYDVVLSWTNPSKYVDGNPATDTGTVHVFRNDIPIGTVPATAAGQPQSFTVPDVRRWVGSEMTFAIQLVVPKSNKPTPVSNAFSIRPQDVPGSPRNFLATVDLGKIVLEWDPPQLKPELVDAYVVQRSDRPAATSVRVPRFDDTEYEPGKTYAYTITAVTQSGIPGEGKLPGSVVAKDTKAPRIPAGLNVERFNDTTVLVSWEPNTEKDLKTYQLFRSDRPDVAIFRVANGYPDADYVPGKGLSYRVLAEDVSGNTSPLTEPAPGP